MNLPEPFAIWLEPDAYSTLGVPPTADADAIKTAYHHCVQLYHPDHNPAADTSARLQAVLAAYSRLSTPEARQTYDSARAWGTDPEPYTARLLAAYAPAAWATHGNNGGPALRHRLAQETHTLQQRRSAAADERQTYHHLRGHLEARGAWTPELAAALAPWKAQTDRTIAALDTLTVIWLATQRCAAAW